MKIIKIIMATTADELKNERKELGDYVRTLNDHYHNKGIYFRLDSLTDIETEEERVKELCDSEFFYIIFSDEADDGIVKKFDIALRHFKEKDKPRIYTYFQKLPDSADATGRLRSFMEKLDKEIGHYYSMFLHLDSIKLNLLLELTRTHMLKETIEVKDEKALVDGKEMLSLTNVPLFQNHEVLQNLLKERTELNERRNKYQKEYKENRKNNVAYLQLSKITDQITEITQQLWRLETEIFETYTEIAKFYHLGRPLKEEEKCALRYIEEGNYDEALRVLRVLATKERLQRTRELAKRTTEESIENIRYYRLRIQTLKATGINEKTIPEIIVCYEECGQFAIEQRIERDIVYEYAEFLFKQNKLTEALEKAQLLCEVYENDKNVGDEKKGELLILIGKLLTRFYKYNDAVKIYQQALEIEEKLVRNGEKTQILALADCYDGFAEVLKQRYCYTDAANFLIRAIESIKSIDDEDSITILRKLSVYYTNLATIQDCLKNFHESEMHYKKAIEIEERLYTPENKMTYGSNVATIYNNYGFSLSIRKDYKKAEVFFNKAIALEKELIDENPLAYEYLLATTYVNLGIILRFIGKPQKSDDLITKAISIFEHLPQENIEAYRNELALSYYSIAENYYNCGRYYEAEEKYKQAILLWEQLTEEKSLALKDKLIEGYLSLGILLSRQEKRFEHAESNYKKAIAIAQLLAKQTHQILFDSQLARCYVAIADLYENKYEEKDNFIKAEADYESAIAIQQRLIIFDFCSYGDKLAHSYTRLANLYRKNAELCSDHDSYIKAIIFNKQALKIYERLPHEERGLASGYYTLGSLYLSLDKNQQAEEVLKKSIVEQRNFVGKTIDDKQNLALTITKLGEALKNQGHIRYREAEAQYNEALHIWCILGTKKNKEIISSLKDEIKKLHNKNEKKKDQSNISLKQTKENLQLMQIAQQGNTDAQYQLGKNYYYGKNKNYAEAVKWFQMAVVNEPDHVKAMYMLGKCYEDGMGIKKDLNEAIKWYRKAADLKYVKAQYKLGVIYYHGGDNFEKNFAEAVRMYRLAAGEGNFAKAQYALGLCYYNGNGVNTSLDEAVKWFSIAAQNGDDMAQVMLDDIRRMGNFKKFIWKLGLLRKNK